MTHNFLQRGCHDAAIFYSIPPHGQVQCETKVRVFLLSLRPYDQPFIECAVRSLNISIDEDRIPFIRARRVQVNVKDSKYVHRPSISSHHVLILPPAPLVCLAHSAVLRTTSALLRVFHSCYGYLHGRTNVWQHLSSPTAGRVLVSPGAVFHAYIHISILVLLLRRTPTSLTNPRCRLP